MVNSSLTVQDICAYGSNKNSGKKIEIDMFLPFILLPILFLIASISHAITITVMVIIGMGVLYIQSRPRQKNRSPFFYSWTLASCITLFVIFEIGILELMEITQLENLVFLILLGCTCYFFYKMKAVADFELATGGGKGKVYSPVLTSDSQYCKVCQIEVNERFFHSIWWDCCVLRPNYPYFLCAQVFSLMTLLYGTNLGLTSICQPFIFYGNILLPQDCSDVYYDYWTAMSFVACVYGLGYVLVIFLILIHHLFVYIPKYTEPQWSKLIKVLNV